MIFHRVLAGFCLLLVCHSYAVITEAQEKPTLKVKTRKAGKFITIRTKSSEAAENCGYTLYASKRRFRLSVNPETADLITRFKVASSSTSAITTKRVPPLRRSRRKPKQLEKVFFRVLENCQGDIRLSAIKKASVRTKEGRKPPRYTQWVERFSERLQRSAARLEDPFPNLNFDRPVDLEPSPTGNTLLYVVEQDGSIYSFDATQEDPQAELFLDLTGRTNASGEQGLLSLAFHPNFLENRLFYVHYSDESDGSTVISEFQASESDSPIGIPASERVLLNIAQPFANHNGAEIAFGPDGFLYIGIGDGGSAGDPFGNAQNRTTLLGNVLRIDVDVQDPGLEYGIPSTNPFVDNSSGYREEIYAWGLRNPFKFSFDSITGELWLGDVGQSSYEEINIIESGLNYGWDTMEGNACYQPAEGCDMQDLVLPIYDYDRSLGGSITGGFVYRGDRVDYLYGKYVYGDFLSGRIFALYQNGMVVESINLFETDFSLSAFGQDNQGELYVLEYVDGKIYKIWV